MPLLLEPMQAADIPAVRSVIFSAFRGDAQFETVFPPEATEAGVFEDWYAARLRSQLADYPKVHMLKVVDTDSDLEGKGMGMGMGKVVAHARWTCPAPAPAAEKETPEQEKEEGTWPNVPWPEQIHRRLIDDYWTASKGWKADFGYDPQKDYVLEMLVTLPEYRGKGAASLLLDYGLEMADKEHVSVFLESSPMARPVYLEKGFEHMKEFVIDLGKYGGKQQPYTWAFMRRGGGPEKK